MRKRLYQPLPEDTLLIDKARAVYKDNNQKRLYSKITSQDAASPSGGISPYLGPFADLVALAGKQFDAVHSFYTMYENEYAKIPAALCANWNSYASTSARLLDLYMRTNKAAWETVLAVACTPYGLTR